MTVAGKVVAPAAAAAYPWTVLAHLAMRTRSLHGASPGAACAAGVRGGRRGTPPALLLGKLRLGILRPICHVGRIRLL